MVPGNHHGGTNSVSQVNGDSDLVPACACWLLGPGGGSRKEQWCLPTFLSWRDLSPEPLLCSQSIQLFPVCLKVPGAFRTAIPWLLLRPSEFVSDSVLRPRGWLGLQHPCISLG